MDFRQLRTLVAIADYGSFVAAADAIGLTQSAVSQQIKALETELRVELFDRSARPSVLTAHGKTFVDRSRQVIAICEDAVYAVSGDRLAGTLSLGVMRMELTGNLAPVLAILRSRYPRLRIGVSTEDAAEMVTGVNTGRLDAAIVPGDVVTDRTLRWMPYTVEPLMVIMPAGVTGDRDDMVLEGNPFIHFSRRLPIAQTIDGEIQRRGIQVTPEMEIDSFTAIKTLVEHGLGVSVVPKQAVERPFPDGVISLPFGDPPLSRSIGIIEKVASPKSAIVSALYAELRRASHPFLPADIVPPENTSVAPLHAPYSSNSEVLGS